MTELTACTPLPGAVACDPWGYRAVQDRIRRVFGAVPYFVVSGAAIVGPWCDAQRRTRMSAGILGPVAAVPDGHWFPGDDIDVPEASGAG